MPPAPTTIRFAWQGVSALLPAEWEPVSLIGTWRSGQVLFAAGRQPRLALTWQRTKTATDLGRTVDRAAKRLQRACGASALTTRESMPGGEGCLVRLVDRDAAVAARRLGSTTVIGRSLPDGATTAQVSQVIASLDVAAEDAASRWCLHGLDITLPPWWRCEGLQVLSGLVRGVWFRQPQGKRRIDHVLVLRRMACAVAVLAGRTLEAYLRASLHRRETATTLLATPEHTTLHGERPGATWWRRLRHRRERRVLDAWVDSTSDRLTVQETTGDGEALPCLRVNVLDSPCAPFPMPPAA